MKYDAEDESSRFSKEAECMLHSTQSMRRKSAQSVNIIAVALFVCAAAMMAAQSKSSNPDLGPNVLLFDPSMPSAAIQQQIDKVYSVQQHSEFGSARYALL